MSDLWKSYDCLNDEGYQHFAVNHSVEFVSADDHEVHTQNIERFWRDLKGAIPKYGRTPEHFPGYLHEFLFKREHDENTVHKFLEEISLQYKL